jgi:hypothetical protein
MAWLAARSQYANDVTLTNLRLRGNIAQSDEEYWQLPTAILKNCPSETGRIKQVVSEGWLFCYGE